MCQGRKVKSWKREVDKFGLKGGSQMKDGQREGVNEKEKSVDVKMDSLKKLKRKKKLRMRRCSAGALCSGSN